MANTLCTAFDAKTFEELGSVFFDDEWDAYGWRTESFTNGPFDTEADALDGLKEELGARKLRIER